MKNIELIKKKKTVINLICDFQYNIDNLPESWKAVAQDDVNLIHFLLAIWKEAINHDNTINLEDLSYIEKEIKCAKNFLENVFILSINVN